MNALAFQTAAKLFSDYSERLSVALRELDWGPVEQLAHDLLDCWHTGRQVFLGRQWRQRRQRQSSCQ